MNYLQLCNRLIEEASISDTPLEAVTGLRGTLAKVTTWINKANRDIERHRRWPWKRINTTISTSPDKLNYPSSELSISDLKEWDLRPYRSKIYLNDKANESFLTPLTYADWERFHSLGTQVPGRPTFIYQDDNTKDACFHPIPDDQYLVTLSYWQKPVDLTIDTDEPLVPEEYHEVIVAKALIDYAVDDEASEIYIHAKQTYIRILNQMEEDLEPVRVVYQPLA